MAETLRAEPVLSSPPLEIFASRPEDTDPMSHPLSGKVAIVTGGSRGIGAAITRRLARDGADVAFSYASNTARAEEMAAAISANGVRAFPIQADQADPVAGAVVVRTADAPLRRV